MYFFKYIDAVRIPDGRLRNYTDYERITRTENSIDINQQYTSQQYDCIDNYIIWKHELVEKERVDK